VLLKLNLSFEHLRSYTYLKRIHVSNVKMSVPNSNFEGHFTTYVFGRCMFLARPQAERWLFYIASTIMKKFIKLFRIIGG